MSDAPWCENSGGRAAAVRSATGVCWRCNRRVKVLSDGRLRRHRTASGVIVDPSGAVAKR